MTLAEAISRGRENYLEKRLRQRMVLIFYMLWRLKVMPDVPGCRGFWLDHKTIEFVPFRTGTMPQALDFGQGLVLPLSQYTPFMVGDTVRVTLYK